MAIQPVFRTTETRIGNTLYIVKTSPSERASETAEQKLARLVSERISAEMKGFGNPRFIGNTACN